MTTSVHDVDGSDERERRDAARHGPRHARSRSRRSTPRTSGPPDRFSRTRVDMAQWLRFQLNDGVVNGKRLVSSAALRETHSPQIVMSRRRRRARRPRRIHTPPTRLQHVRHGLDGRGLPQPARVAARRKHARDDDRRRHDAREEVRRRRAEQHAERRAARVCSDSTSSTASSAHRCAI